ncbi:hypothetical protein [Ornithinimicrobium sp. W1665]|uniref:hypothetical protein n=1 Tax=Ornithinimicrobium sp. W1665 TaxID=3416666 RepID=UPI003CF2385F
MGADTVRAIHLGSRQRVLRFLLTAILLLIACALAAEATRALLSTDGMVRRGKLLSLFDADVEDSFPTWFQGMQLAFAGFLSWAWRKSDAAGLRWGWSVLAALLIVMSLDELISLHEELIGPLQNAFDINSGPLFFAWVIPGVIAAAIFAFAMIPFLRQLPRVTAVRLIVAGAVFVTGAAGMELVGGQVVTTIGTGSTYRLTTIAEESLEMVGTFLVIRTLLLHFSLSNSSPVAPKAEL